MSRVVGGIATVCMLAALIGCVPLPRYKAIDTRPEPYSIERLTEELDPWLLADGFADALVIEIDWVEGCKPGPRTLRGFERIVRNYLPADREIRIELDDEIPLDALDEESRGRVQTLVQQFAGTVAEPEDRSEIRYVLFVPGGVGSYGYSTEWVVEREGRKRVVRGVVVSRRAHQQSAKLWLSRDRIERGTLIHEFGHQFGLVTNDRHERVHEHHRRHCTSLGCLMAHPTPRVIVRNAPGGLFNLFPRDYCRRCREDIRRVKEYWSRQMKADPGYRMTRVRQREIENEGLFLWGMVRSRQYEAVLEEVRRLEQEFPDSVAWAGIEFQALRELDRQQEALARLLPRLPVDPADREYWRWRQWAGQVLVGLGRHQEAIELFDRSLLPAAGSYDFEQSVLVLRPALVGMGRYAEAAALIEELLQRGHDISFHRPGMVRQHAALLRRAGLLDEAEQRVAAGLGKRKQRGTWLHEARALRQVQGRTREAQEFLVELRDDVDRAYREATDLRWRWWSGWRSVALLVDSGERESAWALAEELERIGDPEGTRAVSSMQAKAPAWIALNELDRAAALVQALSIAERFVADPCGMEALEPLRRSPDHADLFESCPARARGCNTVFGVEG